jgi:hypothetical protein
MGLSYSQNYARGLEDKERKRVHYTMKTEIKADKEKAKVFRSQSTGYKKRANNHPRAPLESRTCNKQSSPDMCTAPLHDTVARTGVRPGGGGASESAVSLIIAIFVLLPYITSKRVQQPALR